MLSRYNTERKYLEGQENRKEIYLFLIRYFTKYGYAPSFKEIAESLNVSKVTVQRHMRQLELDGLINEKYAVVYDGDNTVTGTTPLDRKLLKEFVLITNQLKGMMGA